VARGDLRDGDAERGEAVQVGDTNLELLDLRVKVARHEALTQQFHTMHLSLDAASAVEADAVDGRGPRQRGGKRRRWTQSLAPMANAIIRDAVRLVSSMMTGTPRT
jgi:hypothetical protein